MAYLSNTPQCSRQIHQRDHLSPKSPSSTIHSGQIASPISGPSIVPTDNDPNWEDTPATNYTTNLTANRPTSSTHLWYKSHQSENTNKQLENILG